MNFYFLQFNFLMVSKNDLVYRMVDEIAKGNKLVFRIYAVLDILSGNYYAYVIKCGNIIVFGDTDRCLIKAYENDKEIYGKDYLRETKDYGEAMEKVIDFFRDLVNKVRKELENRRIEFNEEIKMTQKERNGALLLKEIIISP